MDQYSQVERLHTLKLNMYPMAFYMKNIIEQNIATPIYVKIFLA